jgi:hypothetical protein
MSAYRPKAVVVLPELGALDRGLERQAVLCKLIQLDPRRDIHGASPSFTLVLGLLAMGRLKAHPDAVKLASGNC